MQAGSVSAGDQYSTKSDLPLPPPPTPTQWAHLYTGHPGHQSHGSGTESQYMSGSGAGGNTYEVPHLPPGTLRYGYSGGYPAHPPSLASSHGIYPSSKHTAGGYYTDRPIVWDIDTWSPYSGHCCDAIIFNVCSNTGNWWLTWQISRYKDAEHPVTQPAYYPAYSQLSAFKLGKLLSLVWSKLSTAKCRIYNYQSFSVSFLLLSISAFACISQTIHSDQKPSYLWYYVYLIPLLS